MYFSINNYFSKKVTCMPLIQRPKNTFLVQESKYPSLDNCKGERYSQLTDGGIALWKNFINWVRGLGPSLILINWHGWCSLLKISLLLRCIYLREINVLTTTKLLYVHIIFQKTLHKALLTTKISSTCDKMKLPFH